MKILIIYVSAGAGHRKAAEALCEVFTQGKFPGISIRNIDALDYTNFFLKRAYPAIYMFLIQYAPVLWGIFFDFFNFAPLSPLITKIRRIFNYFNSTRLVRYILKEQPDVVVCVHFFPAEVVSNMKLSKKFNGCVVCGITDFGVHQFWINNGTDYFFVANESTKCELNAKGIDVNKILLTGIPIADKFSKQPIKGNICNKVGLNTEESIVVVASGGFGIGPIKKIVTSLDVLPESFQIVVICGKNIKLYDFLRNKSFAKNVKILAYVDNMDEIMSVAELIITKSGGLTVSEALAKSLPMIIIRPIPGQETRNAEVLEEYNVGIRLSDVCNLTKQVRLLLGGDKLRLNEMRKNASKIAKPDSAKQVCQWIIQNLSLKN